MPDVKPDEEAGLGERPGGQDDSYKKSQLSAVQLTSNFKAQALETASPGNIGKLP